jgi:hypothetical protein
MGPSPFKEAGIEGFTPLQPFQIAAHFLTKGDFRDFYWPMLSELNDKICPLPWDTNKEPLHILSGNHAEAKPISYTGPPPALVAHRPPIIPPISSLVTNIINSSDKLFFVSHLLGNPSARKWRLVRVAFANSTAFLLSCLQDGHFLVYFYTLHYSDVRYNATNQQYWLQYHMLSDITTPTSSTSSHLIRPSNTSEAHAA